MGWMFTKGATKNDEISRVLKNEVSALGDTTWTTLKSKVTREGGYVVVWAVRERTDMNGAVKYIICCLLDNQKGYGWGYKDMSELMGPCYYSCPVEWFDGVSVDNAEWRESCRKWAEDRKNKSSAYKLVEVGKTYKIIGSKAVPMVTMLYKQGRSWIGNCGGKTYKIPRQMLGEMIVSA